MPFEFKKMELQGLVLVCPRVFGDARGFFLEYYKQADFVREGLTDPFVQDNYSRSSYGVLRGLHYQISPKAQGKLIVCMRGRIYDVAVDIRKSSPHYGKWAGIELTEENRFMLYVPPGFAHGFQVLSDSADVMYKCTEVYSPPDERGVIWNDPDIGIAWPLVNPVLSGKDRLLPALKDAENNFTL